MGDAIRLAIRNKFAEARMYLDDMEAKCLRSGGWAHVGHDRPPADVTRPGDPLIVRVPGPEITLTVVVGEIRPDA